MSTEHENAKNELYTFQYGNEPLSPIVTYRSNLIAAVQNHPQAAQNAGIRDFSTESVTDAKFERFLSIAKPAHFKIYKVVEL